MYLFHALIGYNSNFTVVWSMIGGGEEKISITEVKVTVRYEVLMVVSMSTNLLFWPQFFSYQKLTN
jgi:hypothetical protein